MPPDPEKSTPTPPSPSEAADSSTGSSAGSDFYGDPGPAFDAENPPAPPATPDEPLPDLAWDTAVVEGCLTAQGQVLHTAIGKGETEWLYTRDELRAIAPPLTRILNRYDATRAAAGTGDEIALLLGLTGYVGRSIQERRAVLAALRVEEEQVRGGPVFGPEERPADFDAGPVEEPPPIPRRGPR